MIILHDPPPVKNCVAAADNSCEEPTTTFHFSHLPGRFMKLSNFKIGARLGLLAALLLLATLFIGLRGLMLNQASLEQSHAIMQQENQIEQVIDTARNAQV